MSAENFAMSSYLVGAVFIAAGLFIAEAALMIILRFIGFFTVVQERQAKVYVLFGNVLGVISEPGLHFLWPKFGWQALIVNWLGQVYNRDLRVDQQYLRSTAVNSEEGAPMGIGVWYEMSITDPVAHVFRNTEPRSSLAASVSNVTVRCLSNLKLEEMLENRHAMSKTVRDEVSPQSLEWGYQLGSVYIRKVHFRDHEMIRQIEEKVVNRLRQVTSAIKQEGMNQVNIIASSADANAAVEFARAAARRPEIVGRALDEIAKDKEVCDALFAILETEQLLEGPADVVLVSSAIQSNLMTQILATRNDGKS
jgi:regulator of protease activity HflC (stomatin/prohibitin superfamily)